MNIVHSTAMSMHFPYKSHPTCTYTINQKSVAIKRINQTCETLKISDQTN